MRKFVLLLAAALIVSAPLVATSTGTSYAAAKKAAKKSAQKQADKVDPNAAIWVALGDLANSIGKPWPAKDESKGKGRAKGKGKAR